MQRYLGTARSRVTGYGWAPAMGMRSQSAWPHWAIPWERPWYAHFLHPPTEEARQAQIRRFKVQTIQTYRSRFPLLTV